MMPRGRFTHGQFRGTAARGFTLLEVLVALFVTSIGLLGIAKIEALAYASTGSAGLRSLAAIEAASLAATMRANRAYWGTTATTITVSGTTISDATLNALSTACTAGVYCDPTTLAAYDLHQWAAAIQSLMGQSNPRTVITCSNATSPINCTIQIGWTERTVAINTQGSNVVAGTGAGATPMQVPTYTLYVEP